MDSEVAWKDSADGLVSVQVRVELWCGQTTGGGGWGEAKAEAEAEADAEADAKATAKAEADAKMTVELGPHPMVVASILSERWTSRNFFRRAEANFSGTFS